MRNSISEYTLPLRILSQVPVLGAMLHCIGKKQPNNYGKLAMLNIVMLLLVAIAFLGPNGFVWIAGTLAGFIALILLAAGHDAVFGKHERKKQGWI